MRKIDYDTLEIERISGIQHVRDSECTARGLVCYTCESGWIKPSCDHFRQFMDGFKCDEKSIPYEMLK